MAYDIQTRPGQWVAWFTVMFTVSIAAGDTITFLPDTEVTGMTGQASYLLDPENAYSIHHVAALPADAFTPVASRILNLGITDTSLWLRMVIRNEHPFEWPVLEFSNPRISTVDLYYPMPGGQFAVKRSGTAYPFYLKEIYHPSPAFMVPVKPGEEKVVYLHIVNTGNLRFWLTLWNPEAFHRYSVWANIGNLLVAGALASLTVFNIIVFASLRERGYLYLAILVLVYLFTHLASTGLGSMLLWPNSQWMGERGPSTLSMLCFAVSALFASSFVSRYTLHPLWLWSGIVLGIICVFGAGVAMFAPGLARNLMLVPITLLMPAYIFSVGVAMWIRRAPFARLFVFTWGSLCVVAIAIALVSLRVIEYPGRGEFHLAIAFLAVAMLWCFALTGRVKQREAEMREMLETQVRERTAELQHALSEVKTLAGLLPMCARCKKIREDTGYWRSVDSYLREHAGVEMSHGICPDCMRVLYPEIVARKAAQQKENPPLRNGET